MTRDTSRSHNQYKQFFFYKLSFQTPFVIAVINHFIQNRIEFYSRGSITIQNSLYHLNFESAQMSPGYSCTARFKPQTWPGTGQGDPLSIIISLRSWGSRSSVSLGSFRGCSPTMRTIITHVYSGRIAFVIPRSKLYYTWSLVALSLTRVVCSHCPCNLTLFLLCSQYQFADGRQILLCFYGWNIYWVVNSWLAEPHVG